MEFRAESWAEEASTGDIVSLQIDGITQEGAQTHRGGGVPRRREPCTTSVCQENKPHKARADLELAAGGSSWTQHKSMVCCGMAWPGVG
jgi:hypothetical protein